MGIETGSQAPDFTLADQHGTPVTLSALRGSRIVLVFYPLAFSRVCHGELDALRDDFAPGLPADVRLLTVSVDSMFAQRAWAEQEGYEFAMLSDFWPHGEVARAYGVFDEDKGLAKRGTFIIDGEGVVRWKVVNPVPEARDVADYTKALAEIS
ncbi:peroxiredoxin [Thermocatellispora tengchongensis]|uniref:Alkyl hydroperoxide reductase E n=1 Tax=Thermocatellispora tengchongensis TaxID=1073253 RepID=A0A840P7F6_9ACTN|nr:peroxiredoxin [Thermocatellispora tengchongensis]MBB5135242.1 peroxiredoxin [Thermocatellispora tengchongensis]